MRIYGIRSISLIFSYAVSLQFVTPDAGYLCVTVVFLLECIYGLTIFIYLWMCYSIQREQYVAFIFPLSALFSFFPSFLLLFLFFLSLSFSRRFETLYANPRTVLILFSSFYRFDVVLFFI